MDDDPDAAGEPSEEPSVSDGGSMEPATVESDGHDVQEIHGIGPAYAERLAEAGVTSVADLRAADPEDLAERTGAGHSRVRGWVERATEFDVDPDSDAETDESDADGSVTDSEYVEDAEVSDEFASTEPTAPPGPEEFTEPEPIENDPEVDLEGVAEDEGLLGGGPETDEEMPLAEHIDEMMRRLSVVFLIGGAVAVTVLIVAEAVEWIPSAVEIINYLWNYHIPGAPELADRRPRVYGPLELILTELKVAGLVGLVIALPVFVYETYLFMRPGLYPHERRYYLAAIPTSLVLALIGVAFAHFLVLPAIFSYFTSYTTSTAVVAFGLRETFNLILLLMGYMAIVFQIPLFIMLAIMMGLVTRRWLEQKRLLFWGGFLGLAFLVSPDPTGMAPIIIAATMVTLFEGTLLLLRWTGN